MAFNLGDTWAENAVGAGSDPTIMDVTNLNDSGAGSLRAALEATGNIRARIMVSGTITLRSDIKCKGNKTVDAIEDGHILNITKARLQVTESDVIIVGLKFTIGLDPVFADDADGFSVGKQPAQIQNVAFVKCSVFWAQDEGAAIWGPNERVAFIECIFAEGLSLAQHSKSVNDGIKHSMGVIIGRANTETNGLTKLTIQHCLFVNNNERNPLVKNGATDVELIGNVIHNPGDLSTDFSQNSEGNIINNIYQIGPENIAANRLLRINSGTSYLSGNKQLSNGSFLDLAGTENGGTIVTDTPRGTLKASGYPAAGQDTLDYVIQNAGHSNEDPHVLRVKYHVVQNLGRIIDRPGEAISHTGNQIGIEADAEAYTFPSNLTPIVLPDPDPTPATPVEFLKGDGAAGDVTLTGLDPDTTYDLFVEDINEKGEGLPSIPVSRFTTLAAPTATSPSVVGTSSNFKWRFADHPQVSSAESTTAVDVLLSAYSVRGSADPTNDSWDTFLASEYTDVIVDEAGTGFSGTDMHQGVAYAIAGSDAPISVTPVDATGGDTFNIASSAHMTLTNVASVPILLGSNVTAQTGTAIQHNGGTVQIGDMVAFALSIRIVSNNNNQIQNIACSGLSNLQERVFVSTIDSTNAVHTHWFTGIATSSTVGPFTATAINSVDWTLSAVRIRG